MILKTLVGFLLGFILGVGGTVFLMTSGAGNYLIAANPRVQQLESTVRELTDERRFLTRRLEEQSNVNQRMTTRFTELEDRFQRLERIAATAATLAAPPTPAPPARAAPPVRLYPSPRATPATATGSTPTPRASAAPD